MLNILEGKKVITASGNDGIVNGDKIMFEGLDGVFVYLKDYNNDFTHKNNSNFDIEEIVKVG